MEENIISFNGDKFIEELKCPICLEIFDEPILEFPNQHILCKKCLFKSNKLNNENNLYCQICRNQIQSYIIPRFIINLLNLVEMKCLSKYKEKECDWKGNAILYYNHIKKCEINKKNKLDELVIICNNMREILGKEITPHLKNEHNEIFNGYVKEWDWLENVNKDWKWWWWASNEWWHNIPCIKCNELWHKYDKEVQVYENKRINILNDLQLDDN